MTSGDSTPIPLRQPSRPTAPPRDTTPWPARQWDLSPLPVGRMKLRPVKPALSWLVAANLVTGFHLWVLLMIVRLLADFDANPMPGSLALALPILVVALIFERRGPRPVRVILGVLSAILNLLALLLYGLIGLSANAPILLVFMAVTIAGMVCGWMHESLLRAHLNWPPPPPRPIRRGPPPPPPADPAEFESDGAWDEVRRS